MLRLALLLSLFGHEVLLRGADSPAGTQPTVLLNYEQAIDDLKRAPVRMSPVEAYEGIIAPAIRVGEAALEHGSAKELRARVARLYAAKGNWISRHQGVMWPFADTARETLEAFRRAYALDERADYLVRRAYAQSKLSGADVEDIEKDARQALQFDPDLASAHGLLGFVFLTASREPELKLAERAAKLREAAAELERAMALAARDDPDHEVPVYLLNDSMARFELANYDTTDRRQNRYAARDAALRATQLNPEYPEYAWEALGNAFEDIAFLLGEEREKNYARAVEAFTRAINARDDRWQPWVSRGRCQVKRVAWGGGNLAHLRDGIEDLQGALQKHPRSAEAHYWLGVAYAGSWPGGEYERASEHFRRAAGVTAERRDVEWAGKAAEEGARLELGEAWRRKGEPAQARRHLEYAREWVAKLSAANAEPAGELLRHCQRSRPTSPSIGRNTCCGRTPRIPLPGSG